MKKITYMLMLFLCFTNIVKAQDFAPSQQAQGLLESKNVTVDYTTGIFHYHIPVCTLRSGDFELPVTVNYTGRGVKQGEEPGLLGYNWTLNTGGVVTRTIRGGVADEDGYSGFLWSPTASLDGVNQRKYDGESDIFTASFNGRSITFIIRFYSYKIQAVPLEKTNVRIESEGSDIQIDGWVITDEQGNRYIFRQKEWTANIYKEDAISDNGVRNKTYVSSWYLSRVEPLNGEPIEFIYQEDVLPSGEQSGILATDYYYWYDSRYEYGRPMQDRPINFSKYQKEFNKYLRLAHDCIGAYSSELQLQGFASNFATATDWILNPVFNPNAGLLELNTKVMGIAASIKNISNVSSELLRVLNNLVNVYSGASSGNAQQACTFFKAARNCVVNCLNEVVQIDSKEVRNCTEFTVRSPLLARIQSADRVVKMQYVSYLMGKRLSHIQEQDCYGMRVSTTYFELDNRFNLSRVQLSGNGLSGQLDFTYYQRPEGNYGYDYHGYPIRLSTIGNKFPIGMDDEAVKSTYLKEISLLHGGSVTADYERNSGLCGMRIKSLVLKSDNSDNASDTISYQYPFPGIWVYNDILNMETVDYVGFSDIVKKSRIQPGGFFCLASGNNGIYYPYVIEHTYGKGSRAYRFHVPERNLDKKWMTFAFWLYGLPLSTATYDEAGHLKQLVKNTYYTDISFEEADKGYMLGENTSYFVQTNLFPYNKVQLQIQAYSYYMDKKKLEDYYKQQGRVLLYSDGLTSYYTSPYEELYVPNVEPRTRILLPEQHYELRFGGATLLKEQSVYQFDGEVTHAISYTDTETFASGTPFHKVEYVYDNAQSVYPTREIQSGSKGNATTIVTQHVVEMGNGTDETISMMRSHNILAPVVKQQRLENGVLQEEKVYVYQVLETDSVCYAGLSGQYKYVPESPEEVPAVSDTVLFAYGKANYILENTYAYQIMGHSYPVIRHTDRKETVSFCPGKLRFPLLKAKGVFPSAIAAGDLRVDESTISSEESSFKMSKDIILPRAVQFCAEVDKLDILSMSLDYLDYARTPEHRILMDIIRSMAHPETPPAWTLDEMLFMISSYRENNEEKGARFEQTYIQLAQEIPTFSMRWTEVSTLIAQVVDINNKACLAYYFQLEDASYTSVYETYTLSDIPDSKKMRLYVVSRNASVPIRYSIVHAGGTATGEFVTPASVSNYRLQTFELNLSGYTGISSLVIEHPKKVLYMAVVPEGTSFEAASYNSDGTVFLQFTQDGEMEMYKYDSYGYLESVTDADGRALKRMENQTITKH